MIDKTTMISKLLNAIADELNISTTMYEKAVNSYHAVGKWIGGMDETLDISIFPQGSFNLGTVIKPITDNDSYDIDLVCKIRQGINWSEKDIKQSVGHRLFENETYRNGMLEEGKRCWKLIYSEFHMDILPCAPLDYDSTKIRLTHKNDGGEYEPRYSDPEGYKDWFVDQMRAVFISEIRKGIYAKTDIEEVPLYSTRTPLQKCIQLLKRHRNIMFEEDSTDAPISIIITTLAAKSYNNDVDLYTALKNIVYSMPKFIERDECGNYLIRNPVISEENFADKWNENPKKAYNFYRWLRKVKKDIIYAPLSLTSIPQVAKPLQKAFGEQLVNKAFNKFGEEMRISREKGSLYISGLMQGLINGNDGVGLQNVRDHTFYGDS